MLTLGHSAGGHLAAWAASRGRFERWRGGVDVTGVVSQAGVLDLRAAHDAGLGGGAAEAFLGHPPTAADAAGRPARSSCPSTCRWCCVHGRDDDIVPISQSEGYVARRPRPAPTRGWSPSTATTSRSIDTGSAAWTQTLASSTDLA